MEFIIHSLFYKALSNKDNEIKKQLEAFKKIINEAHQLHPIFSNLHINNAINPSKPLGYPFPSDEALRYFYKSRKKDPFDSALLWNGKNDSAEYISVTLNSISLKFGLENQLDIEILENLLKILLKYLKFKYIFISNHFFRDTIIFEHRHPVSAICFVPQIISENSIPHLYKKIDVLNDLNQGSILIFDENIFEESDRMKKIIEENAIALVALNAIPETELDSDFFSEVDL
ncbi:immunity 52 family protein [Acinetobacter bereziniae]|uniref:immunity 52 family protein n=1 Tax=Acinetobacter bereziniae TaxID=106648 RepID=UPI001ABC867E|nr:immunity 52 family protein [Acinetobacter bereziniae]MBO3652785.1 immunity 52 family protein [Acinetobacter bereziniae]